MDDWLLFHTLYHLLLWQSNNHLYLWWHQSGEANNPINTGDECGQHTGTINASQRRMVSTETFRSDVMKGSWSTVCLRWYSQWRKICFALACMCVCVCVFLCEYPSWVGQWLHTAHKLQIWTGIQNTSSTTLYSQSTITHTDTNINMRWLCGKYYFANKQHTCAYHFLVARSWWTRWLNGCPFDLTSPRSSCHLLLLSYSSHLGFHLPTYLFWE